MFYRCPGCSKVYDGYVEKCPECGGKISVSDSISDSAAGNILDAEEEEEKFRLLDKRIRNGYIGLTLCLIALLGVSLLIFIIFDIPVKLILALEPVLVVVFVIILVVISKKCHFFCCPHCDVMLKSHNALISKYCPHCGKRIRK